jgi:HPt (histidine-containing phosphotransfer) domain-containing protein
MPRTFDEDELLERVDNDWEFLGETVHMLSADAPRLITEIRRATESGDAPAVARAAHALKGMISNFCSPATQASALELEQIGKAGDLAPAADALAALEVQVWALIAELNEFVTTKR